MRARQVWAWAPAVAWALLIVTMSSLPSSAFDAPEHWWEYDKLIHAVVFGVLAALLMRAMMVGLGPERWRVGLLFSVGLTSVFGVTDEWHQSFTPGRDSSGADVVADMVGAVLGAVLVAVLYRRRTRSSQL